MHGRRPRGVSAATLNHEKRLESGVRLPESLNSRGKRVDPRNGEDLIPPEDEPDLGKVAVP